MLRIDYEKNYIYYILLIIFLHFHSNLPIFLHCILKLYAVFSSPYIARNLNSREQYTEAPVVMTVAIV